MMASPEKKKEEPIKTELSRRASSPRNVTIVRRTPSGSNVNQDEPNVLQAHPTPSSKTASDVESSDPGNEISPNSSLGDSSSSPDEQLPKYIVSGREFNREACPFCALIDPSDKLILADESDLKLHVQSKTHAKGMDNFRTLTKFDFSSLPSSVQQVYTNFVAVQEQVSPRKPAAPPHASFFASLKALSNQPTAIAATNPLSSLGRLPSSSLPFDSKEENEELEVESESLAEYCLHSLSSDSGSYQMSLHDWGKYSKTKRQHGEQVARALFPGQLECQPCGKKLPWTTQIEAHLNSTEHRSLLRLHLIEIGYTPSQLPREKFGPSKKRSPAASSKQYGKPARPIKKHKSSPSADQGAVKVSKVAWKCLNRECNMPCVCAASAKTYVCNSCNTAQRPQML